jgi:hypothetical protein
MKRMPNEVSPKIGSIIHDEMLEAHHLSQTMRLEQVGWCMSSHAYFSLVLYVRSNLRQRLHEMGEFKFAGLPVFISESLTPFLPLFSPSDAGRFEWKQRRL